MEQSLVAVARELEKRESRESNRSLGEWRLMQRTDHA